jgi:hypothetical protein
VKPPAVSRDIEFGFADAHKEGVILAEIGPT